MKVKLEMAQFYSTILYHIVNVFGSRWAVSRKSSRGNFSGPESCFMFARFAFKTKVVIILKVIK